MTARASCSSIGASVRERIATFPLCCPSRASWITGQYAHNHGVIDNQERNGGGYRRCASRTGCCPPGSTQAGYDTALVGKWLHDYRTLEPGAGLGSLLGADLADDGQLLRLRDHRLARGQGRLRRRRGRYVTDALTRDYALPYIRAHEPATRSRSSSTSPTPRRTGDAAATTPPAAAARTASRSRSRPRGRSPRRATRAPSPTSRCRQPPSFNEGDMSDKPGAVRGRERSTRPIAAGSPSATAASSRACSRSTRGRRDRRPRSRRRGSPPAPT